MNNKIENKLYTAEIVEINPKDYEFSIPGIPTKEEREKELEKERLMCRLAHTSGTVRVKLDKGAKLPEKAHDLDAGYDLFAREAQVIPAKEYAVFDTGVHIELPEGTVGMLKSKSGLNVKHNLVGEGVIDAGYTGSIKVKLYNHGGYDYKVNAGDKVSQLVILPIYTATLVEVDELGDTERGGNGFGSTGK